MSKNRIRRNWVLGQNSSTGLGCLAGVVPWAWGNSFGSQRGGLPARNFERHSQAGGFCGGSVHSPRFCLRHRPVQDGRAWALPEGDNGQSGAQRPGPWAWGLDKRQGAWPGPVRRACGRAGGGHGRTGSFDVVCAYGSGPGRIRPVHSGQKRCRFRLGFRSRA